MIQTKKCRIIAEIGCNHLGQMSRAKNLIQLARICDADYAKFQKRNPDESTPEHIKNKPHPNTIFSYGDDYLQHRKALEFDEEQHHELYDYCDSLGIGYACSVWDLTSAKEIASLHPDFIKIGSATNQNLEIIDYLMTQYTGSIHISLGMTSKDEIDYLVRKVLLTYPHAKERVVLYHCTSEYPCPFERLFLLDIPYLIDKYQVPYGFEIGFSNHGYGFAADIAAWMLGATWIERHFVDDRTIKHSDAAASLEPDGLRRLCRDLKNIHTALLNKSEITTEELIQRRKLRP